MVKKKKKCKLTLILKGINTKSALAENHPQKSTYYSLQNRKISQRHARKSQTMKHILSLTSIM